MKIIQHIPASSGFRRSTSAAFLFLGLIGALAPAVAQPATKSALEAACETIVVERDVEYAKAGDVSLKLDVYRPSPDGGGPRPCIVWIFGGGWQRGSKSSGSARLATFVKTFVQPGNYVLVAFDYRLTGVAAWPAQIYDSKAAIRFLRAEAGRFGIDPDRIGVWGSSAGGHLAALLGTSGDIRELEGDLGVTGVSSRVTCVVDYCGPSDFATFAATARSLNRPGRELYSLFGGPVEERVEAARAASPVAYVSKDDPPFLIVHGSKDTTVPTDQSRRLHGALKAAGCNSTLVEVEGAGHVFFSGPEAEARVVEFFGRYLLGAKSR